MDNLNERENLKERLKLINTFKEVFAEDNEQGQLILKDLARFCHFKKPLYNHGEALDPYALFRAEGMRNVYLYIMSVIEYDTSRLMKELEIQEGENE